MVRGSARPRLHSLLLVEGQEWMRLAEVGSLVLTAKVVGIVSVLMRRLLFDAGEWRVGRLDTLLLSMTAP